MKMDEQKLYSAINDILKKAVNHRYHSSIPANPLVQHGRTNKITSGNGEVIIHTRAESINYFAYRLPQTRVHCIEYEHAFVKYIFINYFHSNLLIIENKLPGKSLELSVEISSPDPFLCSVGVTKTERRVSICLENTAFFWFRPPDGETCLQDMPAFLNKILNFEYDLHPLHKTYCQDQATLKEIDEIWSALEITDSKGDITPARLNKLHPAAILLLQEIYLHLGKEEQFEKLFKLSKNKYNGSITELLKSGYGEKKLRESKKDEKSFLEILLDREQPSHKTDILIQGYWEYISQPFLEYYLAGQMKENALEIIAFALLALYKNFWWFDLLYNKIISELPAQTQSLITLLLRLKRIIIYQKTKSGFRLQQGNEDHGPCYLENRKDGFTCSFASKGTKKYTMLSMINGLQFRISSSAILEYHKQEKRLEVKPALLKPPVKDIIFNKLEIGLDGFTVQIPLVWEQFEININAVRVRILQKKGRFQLTFRQRNDFPRILLNGRKIIFNKDKKLKTYLNIDKKNSLLEILPFSISGVEIKSIHPKIEQIKFCGNAFDVFGVMRNSVNISFNESNHSKSIVANKNSENIFSVSYELKKYRLTARKCFPIEKEFSEGDSFFENMRNTPAHVFRNDLVVFLMNDDRDKRKYILNKFYKKFAFYPEIESYEYFLKNTSRFSFIFGTKPPGTLVSEHESYQVIAVKNRKAVFILKANIDDFLG